MELFTCPSRDSQVKNFKAPARFNRDHRIKPEVVAPGGVDVGYDPITQGSGRIDAISAVEQTLKITPDSFCYVIQPAEYSKEVLEISNTGTEIMEIYLSAIGDKVTP